MNTLKHDFQKLVLLMYTLETELDQAIIEAVLFAFVNETECIENLGLDKSTFVDEFSEFVECFNHMGLNTIADVEKAHERYLLHKEEYTPMKDLQTIINELQKQLPSDIKPYIASGKGRWKIYYFFSGYIKEEYFALYFRHHNIDNKEVVEIASITDNPQYFIDIIKAIEPKANITYYESVLVEKTI